MTDGYFNSPEAAALAGSSQTPKAVARVAKVTVRGQRAEVLLDLEPAHRDRVHCVQGADGWRPTVSGHGPTVHWDDPDAYGWET